MARKRKGRKLKVNRFKKYEASKFFEPHFVVDLNLYVYNKNNSVVYLEIHKVYQPGDVTEYRIILSENGFIKSARVFLKALKVLEKSEDYKDIISYFDLTN